MSDIKPVKFLKNWRTIRCPNEPARYAAPETLDHFHLSGELDGVRITTGRVVRSEGRDVWTASGSRYHLGPVAPDFAAWLAQYELGIDEANPVKLLPRRN